MAKMIKCPTCGTQIEVPAQPTGQVVKCPGCGKGLKLVAKKPPGQPAGGGTAEVGSGSRRASGRFDFRQQRLGDDLRRRSAAD